MVNFSSCAKWILSGEHAVVRGGKAIAFPLHSYSSCVTFEESDNLIINTDQECHKNTIIVLLNMASEFSNIQRILGRLTVKNSIPLRAGLGSSAAICVNISSLFKHLGYCEDVSKLAIHLEDKFHKKSSGLDIAVVLEKKPIVFQSNRAKDFLTPKFWPNMALTYSGEKSPTFVCINIVADLFSRDKKLASKLDDQMNYSSDLCEEALRNGDFYKLKDGIMLGNEVFHKWGLYNDSMSAHVKKLFSQGASAVKPIGSGLGGYALSLWSEKPTLYVDQYLTLGKP